MLKDCAVTEKQDANKAFSGLILHMTFKVKEAFSECF